MSCSQNLFFESRMKSVIVIAVLVSSAFVSTEGSSKKHKIKIKFTNDENDQKLYMVNVHTSRLPFEPRNGSFHIVVQSNKISWLNLTYQPTVIRPNYTYPFSFVYPEVQGLQMQWTDTFNKTQTPVYLNYVSITETKKSKVQYFCPQPRSLPIYSEALTQLTRCATSSSAALSVSNIIMFLVSCIVLYKTICKRMLM